MCLKTLSSLLIGLHALGYGTAALSAQDPNLNAPAAVVMRTSYAALSEQLRTSPFGRPLLLSSTETPARLGGEVYAVVDYRFDVVESGLSQPQHWCEVLLLHINTKFCRASVTPLAATLTVFVGKKTPQELATATRIEFEFATLAHTPEYLALEMTAGDGPLGTSDYVIRLEAIPISKGQSFVHLTYAYATHLAARLAMQTYLLTGGAGKVGFTVDGGVRGMVERNTMRYYLAVASYLEFVGVAPPQTQFERRLSSWYSAVERYPRQLHDLERDEYLSMKRSEFARQGAAP